MRTEKTQCNTVYYHLFSMCHIGIEPYTFPQGSVPIWEGSPNFLSEGSTSENLLANNIDFYASVGRPEIGESIGVTDNKGVSCMIYVGHIPFPVVNVVKFTKSIISANKFSDCATCISLAVKGCVDSLANNYNPLATIGDGSCTYSNLPCSGCCIDAWGNQYTPTQPCYCMSGYSLTYSPCVVVSSTGGTGTTGTCVECCYSKSKGIYKPSNENCSCDKGDTSSPCREVEDGKGVLECDNCCTNKSGRIFKAEYSYKYGCSCVSGSWAIPCEGEEIINQKIMVGGPCICRTYQTQPDGSNKCIEWSPPGCGDAPFKATTYTKDDVITSVNTCMDKIDSGFNETPSHLSISNHLDNIRNTSGGHTKNWSTYKFKHHPHSKPTNHDNLCLAIEGWGDVPNAYWAYVKDINITYNPEGVHEDSISRKVTNFSELCSYTADTIPVTLDNTKEVWDAMEVWNNDITVWTPGLFSFDYSVVYCDCKEDVEVTEKVVHHVFGGEEGTYVIKEDNLTNYKCVSGTNPIVEEIQQTCVTTDEPVGDGVYDNINNCINSGCGGYMHCNPGVTVDGIQFDKGEKTYTPIVMCCERLIQNSRVPLTREICQSECGGTETWYPLYNAFAPNLVNESLLGYMVRDLLNKVNNRECVVSKNSNEFRALGYVERLK